MHAINPESIYSVESLNNTINQKLQTDFSVVYVEGEISNLTKPASGHYYFSLKDQKSQIRCALFQGFARLVKIKLENGLKILVKAKISIYVPRGDYQLIIENIYPTGAGALQLAYEQLLKKLQSEGLFDNIYKKKPPAVPNTIWVITSPTGAAIRDILITLNQRFPNIPVNIIPTLVQGDTASINIIKALKFADKHSQHNNDVIIIARGGGSIEDLWAFNNEDLARTIFATKTVVITGIGHETDFTIADFVADIRAATPTAAAQLASPNKQEYFYILNKLQQDITKLYNTYIYNISKNLEYLNHRLRQQHPETKIFNQMQQLDELYIKFNKAFDRNINTIRNNLHLLNYKLHNNNPINLINLNINKITYIQKNLSQIITNFLHNNKNLLTSHIKRLNSINPLEILARGYSIITDLNGHIIKSNKQVKTGELLKAKLHDGELHLIIKE